MKKLVMELTCATSGKKVHVVKSNVCHWEATEEGGSCLHMVCNKCVCVKECQETVHAAYCCAK